MRAIGYLGKKNEGPLAGTLFSASFSAYYWRKTSFPKSLMTIL